MVKLSLRALVAASLLLVPTVQANLNATEACIQISKAISSSSEVFWPGSIHYGQDTHHWATSSSQLSACSVEPGTAEDVGKILQIVGSTRTPFSVKGGGHATNPGFSSSTGVHIALTRLNEVTYHAVNQTATVGAGLVWDDVYEGLEPHGVNVVGGRVTGVGVAGFTLGGGYSWLSNQYGLTVDNTLSYELVFPNGTVSLVDSSNPDLLFALKGSAYNNYGIVTRFNFKAYPQGQVWGGLLTATADQLDAVNEATLNFSNNVTDPKAQIITAYNFVLGEPGASILLFYDGPSPPAGIFDDFLAIKAFTKDVKTRSFLSLVQSSPSDATSNQRGAFHTVSLLEYTPALIDAIVNETRFLGPRLGLASATFLSYDVEPFLPSIFAKGTTKTASYPPSRAQSLLPLNLYFAWTFSAADETIRNAIVQSAEQITKVAVSEGQSISNAPLYSNYAIDSTPKDKIFGENLSMLQILKAQYDPSGVMDLAGGWKFQ
ncbi:FAD dependent oxidoreductase [Irpex rosettiformis]|uniref:FAD dependent oxidoreductase n=1 Tax=Irpex rosettiformis TaxID=378272 RepID=A0ACB8U290_9APHY|nr:FAD dependent oxidoreductase [Irpex rosettiformis]